MKQYVVDAFADKLLSRNPAAVCMLEKQISDELMQNIAKKIIFRKLLLRSKMKTDTAYVGLHRELK